jgi:hypothetical protein
LRIDLQDQFRLCFGFVQLAHSLRKSIKMNITRLSRAVIRQLRPIGSWRLAANSLTLVKTTANEEFRNQRRNFSVFSKSPEYSESPLMDLVTFEGLCSEALESLTDYFEEIVEADPKLQNADVAYSVSGCILFRCLISNFASLSRTVYSQ